MKCIVGLGNPGRKYVKTRHNVGYMVLDELAGRFGLRFSEEGFSDLATGIFPPKARPCEGASPDGVDVILVRPLTFMNLSGKAVSDVIGFHGLAPEDVLVLHDDLDLPLGRVRIRRQGSSGGHKGVLSVAEYLDSTTFPRLKIGIGRPPEGVDPISFVLAPFEAEEAALLQEVIALAADAAHCVVTQGVEQAMDVYNGPHALRENGDA